MDNSPSRPSWTPEKGGRKKRFYARRKGQGQHLDTSPATPHRRPRRLARELDTPRAGVGAGQGPRSCYSSQEQRSDGKLEDAERSEEKRLAGKRVRRGHRQSASLEDAERSEEKRLAGKRVRRGHRQSSSIETADTSFSYRPPRPRPRLSRSASLAALARSCAAAFSASAAFALASSAACAASASLFWRNDSAALLL